jgi:hypothetical protein
MGPITDRNFAMVMGVPKPGMGWVVTTKSPATGGCVLSQNTLRFKPGVSNSLNP